MLKGWGKGWENGCGCIPLIGPPCNPLFSGLLLLELFSYFLRFREVYLILSVSIAKLGDMKSLSMLLLLFLLEEYSGNGSFRSEFLLYTAPKVFEEFKPNVAIPPYPDWYL